MSKVEVKRFFRKTKEYLAPKPQRSDANKEKGSTTVVPPTSCHTLCFGGIEFQRLSSKNTQPWAQAKYGWIPNPKTDRAKFMNEVLPNFYKACYSKCKNTREFVKLFHSEGRRQYESHERVSKFFDEQYVHIPSDQLILRENMQKLVKVQEQVEKEKQDIKGHLSSLYTKSGKLKDGKGSQKDFDEKKIGVLTMLRENIISNIKHLQDQESKCKDMFHGHILKFKSKKRSKKENKRKAQKRKARREEENFDAISKLLSITGETPIQEINADALMSLKGKQIYWLKQMIDRKLISDKACGVVKEYLPSICESSSNNTSTGQ